MRFKPISKELFEAYFYGRTPFVRLFSTEIEWLSFETGETTLLVVVLRCEIDKDFNAIVLGRDMKRKFRAIDVIVSKETREQLLLDLGSCIDGLVCRHVDGIFPQGDEEEAPFAIFGSHISQEKRNHYLKLLTNDPVYFPARVMMEELAHWFEDPDGVFIRAMQGNEFNSRLFELYLHAVFYELDFEMDRTHPQPDYLLKKAGQTIALEATTVSEMEGSNGRGVTFDEKEKAELLRHVEEEMPFKFARTLLKKVRHRPEPSKLPYWDLPHTKDHPFVVAVHDYSRTMSMSVSSSAMQSYLYGVIELDGRFVPIENHQSGTRTMRSNFFGHDGNKHVSAVMLATGATLPKFNRMGRVAGLRSPTSIAIIRGVRTNADGEPHPFSMLVEHPLYREYWHEGIFIFHNPNAVQPLDPNLFPHVVHVFMQDDGRLVEYLPPNYIVSSTTEMMLFDKEDADRVWDELCAAAKDFPQPGEV